MHPHRRSRRQEFERNLQRLRSSQRIQAVGGDSSGRVKSATPPPSSQREVDPFQALGPSREAQAEFAALREEVSALRRLQEAIHFLGGAGDLATLRADLLDLALSVSGLRRGMLALGQASDDSARRVRIKEVRGFSAKTKGAPEVKVLRRILDDTLTRREPLLEGCMHDGGILEHAARAPRLGAVAALPLNGAGGEPVGVLLLDDPQRARAFTTAEASALRSFARHAGQALHRVAQARRTKRKAALLQRRTDRLEAQVASLERRERKVQAATRRLRQASQRLETATAQRGDEPALAGLCAGSYARSKRAFTGHYLTGVMRDAGGDLRAAARLSELPLARLIGLLDALGLSAADWS